MPSATDSHELTRHIFRVLSLTNAPTHTSGCETLFSPSANSSREQVTQRSKHFSFQPRKVDRSIQAYFKACKTVLNKTAIMAECAGSVAGPQPSPDEVLFVVIYSRADGVMRTMNTEKLIKTLPHIQNQLDALLDFQVNRSHSEEMRNSHSHIKKCLVVFFPPLLLRLQPNSNELTNGVINTAFMLLFKDSIRLFAAYNEGVINMLGEPSARDATEPQLISIDSTLHSHRKLPQILRSHDGDSTRSVDL